MRRKVKRRSGAFKRKTFRKRKGSLRKKIQRVARQCRPEYKIFDDTTADITYSALNAIPVGNYPLYKYFGLDFGAGGSTANDFGSAGNQSGNTQGFNPRFISFTIRGEVGLPSSFTGVLASVRMIWFWDNDAAELDNTGVIVNKFPSVNSHILAVQSNAALTTPTTGGIFTGYNPTMVGPGKRFKILRDRTYQLSAVGSNTRKFILKLRVNKTVGMISVGNAVVGQNLGLMMVSDTIPGSVPYVTFATRLCYTG